MLLEVIIAIIAAGAMTTLLGKYINSSRTVRLHVNRIENFEPKVSVIIPTWNEEKVIEGTIRNVEESFYKNLEILVIDDHSTDKTLEILKKLEKEFDNIKVLVKRGRKGKAQSINEAFHESEGDIILLLDADARIPKTYISTHISCFSREDIRMIFTDFEAYNYKKGRVHEHQELFFSFVKDVVYSNMFVKMIFMGNGIFFRREILEKALPIDPETLVDDFSLAMRLKRIGVVEYFSTYPKIGIQYVNDFRQLWRQHMRWFFGGFREIIKWMRKGDLGALGLYIFSILFFFSPLIFTILSVLFTPAVLNFFWLLALYVYSIFVFSQLLDRDRKLSLTSAFYMPLIVMGFELAVITVSFIKAHMVREEEWYKVDRDEA